MGWDVNVHVKLQMMMVMMMMMMMMTLMNFPRRNFVTELTSFTNLIRVCAVPGPRTRLHIQNRWSNMELNDPLPHTGYSTWYSMIPSRCHGTSVIHIAPLRNIVRWCRRKMIQAKSCCSLGRRCQDLQSQPQQKHKD